MKSLPGCLRCSLQIVKRCAHVPSRRVSSLQNPHRLAFDVSRNILNTAKPPIPQANQWKRSYQGSDSHPLIDMSQGVPGVAPPQLLLDRLAEYSAAPSSCGYTSVEGETSLREILAQEMKFVYGNDIDLGADDITLTAGCNMAFVATIMVLADPGDEVILPVPWYFNHQMTLDMLGVKTVCLPTYASNGFIPRIDQCEKLITPKTKAIALVTPNNPTGATYPPSLIASFAALAKKHKVALVLDETYRDLIIGDIPHHLFSVHDSHGNWRETLIHLFSFSKSYCVPGHRLGAIAASPAMLSHIATVLDTVVICPPRPIQLALASTLPMLRPFIKQNALAIASRHSLFKSCLPSAWKIGSQGGYYAFVRHPFKRVSAKEVSERLAVESGIATLPAEFFSADDGISGEEEENRRWIRFSVANVDDVKVRKVCARLAEVQETYGWELD